MNEARTVIVKILILNTDAGSVFNFFSDLKNWESGGVLKNTKLLEDGSWQVETPSGKARIRIRANINYGIFDHDFIVGGEEWTVHCRVTRNGTGSTVTWTFVRPEGMSQEEFERQLGNNFDKEMEGYKEAILSKK